MAQPINKGVPGPANVGVLFCDIQNSSNLRGGGPIPVIAQVLSRIAAEIRTLEIKLIDLNTWGDAVFATSQDVPGLADLALRIRDIFLHAPGGNPVGSLSIRIALDFIKTTIAFNPITQTDGCMDSRLTRAARLEPVTPANSVFVTSAFADYLADNFSGRIRSDDVELKRQLEGAPQSDGPPNLFLCRFKPTIRLPKGAGELSVFSLHHITDEPGVVWTGMNASSTGDEAVKRANAIGPILINPWLIRDPETRHNAALERLKKCNKGDKVCFISITGKAVLCREPGPRQYLHEVNEVAGAIKKGVTFRGVVMAPDSPEARLRSAIESGEGKPVEERMLQEHARQVAALFKNSEWKKLGIEKSLALRRTRYGISFSLWLFGDQAIIEPYHLGRAGSEGFENLCQFSQFTIFRERGAEYEMLKAHFERLWEHSDPVD